MLTKSKPHAEEPPKAIFLNAIKISLMLRSRRRRRLEARTASLQSLLACLGGDPT